MKSSLTRRPSSSGGISRKFEKWGPHLDIETPVMPAQLRNRAGIVGAAMAAVDGLKP